MRAFVLLTALGSCATVKTVEAAALNCGEASITQNLPSATAAAFGALTGSNSTAALNQLLVTDGLDLAYCAVQAAVTALENGGAVAPLSPMVRNGAVAQPVDNVVAIARGEAWLAAHSR
jgi:hypothetical protein